MQQYIMTLFQSTSYIYIEIPRGPCQETFYAFFKRK